MAWKREDSLKLCKHCQYWVEEAIDFGHVCVNANSIHCSDWREEEDSCPQWTRKEEKNYE